VLGIAHHAGHRLTLEQVANLKAGERLQGPAGSCLEVQGLRVEFSYPVVIPSEARDLLFPMHGEKQIRWSRSLS